MICFIPILLTISLIFQENDENVRILADFSPENTAVWRDSGGGKTPMSFYPNEKKLTSSGKKRQGGQIYADFSKYPEMERTSHDLHQNFDLSAWSTFELDVNTENNGAFYGSTLYFHSGDGWYNISGGVPQNSGTILFSRADAISEGNPAGWGKIDRIRISFWKLNDLSSKITLFQLRAKKGDILLLGFQNKKGVLPWNARNNANILTKFFAKLNMSANFIEIPENPEMDEASWDSLFHGREMVLVTSPQNMPADLRQKIIHWAKQNQKTYFFADQNFHEKLLFQEEFFHTMIKNPMLQKHIILSFWEMCGFENCSDAYSPEEKLQKLQEAYLTFSPDIKKCPYSSLFHFCQKERQKLLRNTIKNIWWPEDLSAPKSLAFRGWWNHSGLGAHDGDWKKTAKTLKQAGFTDVFPNLLWASEAHYPSSLIPPSKIFQKQGDLLKACLDACHAEGLRVHVWKVNFRLKNPPPPEFLNTLRQQKRLQQDINGEEILWLCPSHPENFELEWRSMQEIVEKYPVDGLHFDYIRYPGEKYCYCPGCRQRFEEASGVTVKNWPQDVLSGPQNESFKNWRQEQITRLVQKVSQEAKKIRPEVMISAAVFKGYPNTKITIGQDWAEWAETGIVDFLCPMNYTKMTDSFRNLTEHQKTYIPEGFPLYPGIGVWRLNTEDVIGQIITAAELGCPGIMLFDLQPRCTEELLPIFIPDTH
ncbi:MAG: family 10 glycosylhydrolase [Planctomycetia bacterium]|nr:family 10 glycosylhydrolase [Planctomycetia bacterium]